MGLTGWQKARHNYSTQMRANLTVTIKTRVRKFAADYIGSLQPDIKKDDLQSLLYKKWPSEEDLPIGLDDTTKTIIKDVRSALGMKDSNALPKRLKGKVTIKLFCFYVHLAKIGLIKKPLLPFANYARKFAYLDSTIANALFPKPNIRTKKGREEMETAMAEGRTFSENRLPDIFDFTTSSARQRKRAHQKKRRKKVFKRRLGKRALREGKKVPKNKKKSQGTSPFLSDKFVSSVMTDGISICVRTKEPRPLPTIRGRVVKSDPKPPKPEEKLIEDLTHYRAQQAKQPAFIGVDYGRAKLYTAASQSIDGKKPTTTTFTRRQYYWEIGFAKRSRWERQRREANPDVIIALQDMSWAGRKHDIDMRVAVESDYRETLLNEFIYSNDRARWSMLAYRWKRSSLDRAANRLIDSVERENNQRLVIGVGNGSFPSTGKGEKAVPTKKFKEHLRRAIFRRQHEARICQESKPITLLTVDEFRTTKCCYQCEAETIAATIKIPGSKKEVVSTRLRFCKKCNSETGKRCDRDVNAARNILRLTKCKYNGEERPQFLRRPPKENNEVVFISFLFISQCVCYRR